MTKHEAAIISAYTGILCCQFSDFHKYVETLYERPVFTHEMAAYSFANELKYKSESDFLKIVKSLA